MARRRRRPRRRYEDEYVEEEYYYEDDGPDIAWGRIIVGAVIFLFVVGVILSLTRRSRRVYHPSQSYTSPMGSSKQQQPQEDLKPVKIGEPKINLKAVEDALWKTKADNPKDFKGWMKKFEDEANAIYFASLKKAKPNADPTTLMKEPLRVEAKRDNGLLTLYGYLDKNKQQGYQNEQDSLIFAFKQDKPFSKDDKKLSYSLRDGTGYYYREPGYSHVLPAAYTAMFLGFFLYPTVWGMPYYRTSFVWWGTPYWRTGFFYNRYSYYYGSSYYGGYYGYYRRTYYRRHRPWGWGRGSYYRRGRGGSYYSRGSRYRSGSRYRGSSRYRSRGSRYRGSGSRYRGSGSRYRGSSRSRSGSRYRGSGRSRSGYRSSGRSRSGYRSSGGKW